MTTTDGPEQALIKVFFQELIQIAEQEIYNLVPSCHFEDNNANESENNGASKNGGTIKVTQVSMIDSSYNSFLVWIMKKSLSEITLGFSPYHSKNTKTHSAIQQRDLKINLNDPDKRSLKSVFRNHFREEFRIFAIREINLPKILNAASLSEQQLKSLMNDLAISAYKQINSKFNNTKIDVKFREDLKTVQINAVPVIMLNDLGALNILIIINEKHNVISMFFSFIYGNNEIIKKKFYMDLSDAIKKLGWFEMVFKASLHEFTKI